jgi:hypothetical protein
MKLILLMSLLELLLFLRLDKLAGLRLQAEHCFRVGNNRLRRDRLKGRSRGRLPPAVHLFWEQAPLSAVSTQLSGIEPSGRQHQRELVGCAPAL